jgi:hypothetical protein
VKTPDISGERENPVNLNPVVANVGKPIPGAKTSGIKIRGTGAATKGTMARGPMA